MYFFSISNDKRARIHEYLSFRAAVKTDAGTAAAAHTDESKVRVARDTPATLNRALTELDECIVDLD
jgi:hypothetical protein